jgi:hypothetical protein
LSLRGKAYFCPQHPISLAFFYRMRFFTWFAVATIAILLLARYMPKSPAEPIIPTEMKESQGNLEQDKDAPPARTEEEGRRDAEQKQGGSTLVVPGQRPALG